MPRSDLTCDRRPPEAPALSGPPTEVPPGWGEPTAAGLLRGWRRPPQKAAQPHRDRGRLRSCVWPGLPPAAAQHGPCVGREQRAVRPPRGVVSAGTLGPQGAGCRLWGGLGVSVLQATGGSGRSRTGRRGQMGSSFQTGLGAAGWDSQECLSPRVPSAQGPPGTASRTPRGWAAQAQAPHRTPHCLSAGGRSQGRCIPGSPVPPTCQAGSTSKCCRRKGFLGALATEPPFPLKTHLLQVVGWEAPGVFLHAAPRRSDAGPGLLTKGRPTSLQLCWPPGTYLTPSSVSGCYFVS